MENACNTGKGMLSALAEGCCCAHEKRRGRPVQIDPDTRTQLIIDAAEAVLADHGLARTTMAGIAKAAGMSKRTVYAHFDTREELILACIARMHEQIVRPLSEAEQALPLRERLDRLLTLNLEASAATRKLELLRSIIAEAPNQPELAASVRRSGMLALVNLIDAELRRAVAEDEAQIDDPALAAEILRDMAYPNPMEALLENCCSHEEKIAQLDRRRACAITFFCRAIGAR